MRSALFLLIAVLSFNLHAEQAKNTLGVTAGLGSMKTSDSAERNGAAQQAGIFYEYHLDEKSSVVGTLISGSNDFCFIACPIGATRKANFNLQQVSYRHSAPISRRWSGFGEVGVNAYQIKYDGNDLYSPTHSPANKNSGINLALGIGVHFMADNGFQAGVKYQYLPMGKNTLGIVTGFLGFSF